jgi:hypothetical protein
VDIPLSKWKFFRSERYCFTVEVANLLEFRDQPTYERRVSTGIGHATVKPLAKQNFLKLFTADNCLFQAPADFDADISSPQTP